VLVEDVRVAPEYSDVSRAVMLDAGILAGQSTPLVSHGGDLLGVISTHFREPHRCTDAQLRLVDLFARHAADFVEYSDRHRQLEEMCERDRIARAEADAANRSKDHFLAMLAHELRQPLSAAFPAIEVQKRSLSPERRRRAGEVIEQQLAHIARLVEDLADASRMMRGTIELRRERLDLRTTIQQAVDMASPLFARYGHTLRIALGDEPVWVSEDPTRLRQVFSNLLQNAATYTPGEGLIEVALQVEGAEAVFRLRDNGMGISADALDRIFELFQRGEHDARSPSVGIGLALVRRLVELHGGHVRALSEGPGQGSEFVVTLPLHPD
jgi:signal transduction histidine kinase